MPKVSAARAAASRRNGAKSRRPKTTAGRARVARNAKHGLCARRMMPLVDEDAAFGAFEAALPAPSVPAAPKTEQTRENVADQ